MKSLLFTWVFFLSLMAVAQPDKEARVVEGQFTFDTDKPFRLLELDEEIEEPIVTKKKKPKKKVFYGIKTKKGFTRKGYGDRVTVELFYYLKNPDKPNRFVRDIYWYDFTRREIRKSNNFDPSKGYLLHGPYRKMQGDILLEEGIYYKGTKHGRWMQYDRQHVLTDKEKYYKGWPKESLIVYYDPVERTKIKEIIPVEFGEREGYYYQFHENGNIAVTGEFKWDNRVGEWIENYPTGRRKKIIIFPDDPFDRELTPFVRSEWNDKGKE
ncbi:MAG: hypothetical protein RIA63_12645, partial [Cyclobacteriaceae bacterium]